ncbi:alginate O-acetyltransferase AlgX-related protein [Chitinimonas sp. BJB300]|uniref:alginate O-acetyltransferase AlgX-related protein n=1 Tax=Chitinimonas sp. BJB300 TaxID=1559339 RepID=UPI000C11F63F|nr:hypothetical protein [Chitinimonas sp. BJB300]PHV12281.1 hypothetical protein CSQ89_06375 [Chitinimonas sp. BJB300]TSJ88142.1 hypothetical protein FG002_011520 [Chitinimonas sp. BJB300]
MNPLLAPITPKKFSLALVLPMLVLALVGTLAGSAFKPLKGDLTRLGQLPESDFGPQQAQAAVPAKWQINTPIAQADMLVIGDSFSMNHVWQSRLQAQGIKTTTVHWDTQRHCSRRDASYGDFLVRMIRESGFKGRYIVLESVEREFEQRMQIRCDQAIASPAALRIAKPTLNSHPTETLGWGWVYKALWHKLVLSYAQGQEKTFGDTKVIALDGCGLFSHQRCDYGLFYKNDFHKPSFDSTQQVAAIDTRLRQLNIQPLWLIVPDKSTVYLGYGTGNEHPFVNIWQTLAQQTIIRILDLGTLFKQQQRKQRDLYLPNDTHLSDAGFLYMGDLVLQTLPLLAF